MIKLCKNWLQLVVGPYVFRDQGLKGKLTSLFIIWGPLRRYRKFIGVGGSMYVLQTSLVKCEVFTKFESDIGIGMNLFVILSSDSFCLYIFNGHNHTVSQVDWYAFEVFQQQKTDTYILIGAKFNSGLTNLWNLKEEIDKHAIKDDNFNYTTGHSFGSIPFSKLSLNNLSLGEVWYCVGSHQILLGKNKQKKKTLL